MTPRLIVPLFAIALVAGGTPVAGDDRGQFGRVIRIEREAFLPSAGLVQFHEVPLETGNPVYRPSDYGAESGGVTVTFGGIFAGQEVGGDQCPPGAPATGCVWGKPSAPLSIDQDGPGTLTSSDGANPRAPSLSGYPRFNGPISMVFDSNVAGVGLMGGFFDALRGTAISVYDRSGNLIGGVVNTGLGMEYLALVTEDGSERIAGLQFSLVGDEPAGFGIDDLAFAKRGQLDADQVPSIGKLLGARAPSGGDVNDADAAPPPAASGSLRDLFATPGAAPERAEPSPAPGAGSLRDLFNKD